MKFRHALILVITAMIGFAPSDCSHAKSKAPIHRYQLAGEILRLDSAAHVAVIKHGPIPGWMEAMTMEYKVEEENEYTKLRVGDQITATVFVQDLDYWIGEIHAARTK